MSICTEVKINSDKLPLSEDERKVVGENLTWLTTENFETFLLRTEINDDGRLLYLTCDMVWDENAERGIFTPQGEKGDFVIKNEQWINSEYHGYLKFHGYVHGGLYEFKAKFTDGKLIKIERIVQLD